MENEKIIIPTPQTGGGQNKIVETYAEDMAKVIQSNKEGGLIKKIIHQQEESEYQKKNLSPKSQKNRLFMVIGILFLLVALGILIFLIFIRKNIYTVDVQNPASAIIYTDETVYKEISSFSKEKIAQTVLNEVANTDIKDGAVEGIYLTQNKKIVGLREFVKLISTDDIQLDNITFPTNNFLLGVAKQTTNNFFILVPVRSFPDIFPFMRNWEGKMFLDLHDFFNVGLTPDTKYLLTKDFEDGIVDNKNARILRDNKGNVIMMYVFADEQSLIISNTTDVVRELKERLQASEVKK